MSAYILTLLSASLAVCVIELLLPKGDGERVASHVRLVSGLFLLVALLNPLREGLTLLRSAASGELGEVIAERLPTSSPEEDYAASFNATLSEVGRREVEAWVKETLSAVFAIPSEGCAVEAVCQVEETEEGVALSLAELRIGLKGKYILEDPHPIETYVSERLGCPCFVTVLL